MHGAQLHHAGQQALSLAQGDVGGHIGLEPLVQRKAGGAQGQKKDIQHGPFLQNSKIPFSLHALPGKSNYFARFFPYSSQTRVRFSSNTSPSFSWRDSEAVLPRRTWQ